MILFFQKLILNINYKLLQILLITFSEFLY